MECTPSYPPTGCEKFINNFSASYFQTNSDESTICSKTPTVGFGICYFVSAHGQIIYIYIERHSFWMFSDTGSQVSSKMSSSLLAIGFCALAGLAILAEHVIFRTDGDMEIVANWLLD